MSKIKHLIALALALAVSFTAAAQDRVTVTGRVVDSEGAPLMGAQIIEKGTTNGNITDAAGGFSLQVKPTATLVVSYLGYVAVERGAAQAGSSPIVMQPDATRIDDLVVIGYGSVRKSDLTGAVATVRADQLNRGAVTSVQGLLQGKVPGLLVLQGDGGPGSKSTIRIRGNASLSATNDPLIVVDGLPLSKDDKSSAGLANPLQTINPNDIESYSILKDASAAAIYGARAANGVIMITTKKGSGSRPQISYNSSYSVSVNSKYVDMMTPEQYRDYILKFYPEGTPNGDKVREKIGKSSTDWQRSIFRPAFATDQNVSLYGNLKKRMPYRLSLGYTDVSGTLKTSNEKRGTIDLSLSPTFFRDHFKVTLNAKESFGVNNYADGGAVSAAAYFDPTQDIYFRNDDGSVDKTKANGWWSWMTGSDPLALGPTNPYAMLCDHFNRSKFNRLTGNVQLDYKLHWLPELRFNLNLGLDMVNSRGREGDRPGSVQALKSSEAKGLGLTQHRKENHINELLEFYVAYDKTVGKHHFDAMAGYTWQYEKSTNDNHSTINDDENTLLKDYPFWLGDHQLLSFFGRFNYGFDGRYLLTVSMRADGSSRFAKGHRWAYSPAAALAWNIKNEGFLTDNDRVTELKLRLGWGRIPQQDIAQGYYTYIKRYNVSVNPNTQYPIDGAMQPLLRPEPFNSNLTWELVDTWNVGVDFSFLRGNLYGNLDFYRRTTHGLLADVTIPRGSGFGNHVMANAGNMLNTGVELALGANIFNTKDFTWTVGTSVTWQSTKITRLTKANDPDFMLEHGTIGGTGNNIQAHKVGYAPGAFYTYQQLWGEDGKPIQNAIVDRDGDGIITLNDRYFSGKKPAPDVFMGLNMKFTWRGWDLGFNSHGSFGNWLFNRFYSDNATPPFGSLDLGFLSNVSNVVHRSGFTDHNKVGQNASDMFLENASFFRMDDITLGYTFPQIFNRIKGSNLRIAFTAQNPFIITRYTGLDPEMDGGIDGNIWPRPRIFSLRMALNF